MLNQRQLRRNIIRSGLVAGTSWGGRISVIEWAPDPASTSERKTGLKHADVTTPRLVQDERGWLRPAI